MPKPSASPPSTEQILSEYAQRICEELARKYGDAYLKPDIVYGFASFLQLTVDIHLKQRRDTSTCEREDKLAENPQ